MVGKRGEASITFEIPFELIKRPSGIKKFLEKFNELLNKMLKYTSNDIWQMLNTHPAYKHLK